MAQFAIAQELSCHAHYNGWLAFLPDTCPGQSLGLFFDEKNPAGTGPESVLGT
jgi:hypothetical protein